MSLRSLPEAIRAAWLSRAGLMAPANVSQLDYAKSNAFQERYSNAAGTGYVIAESVDSLNQLTWGGGVNMPVRQQVNLPIPLNAGNVDQCVFIAPYPMTITGIQEFHATAGDDASAVTLNLTKDPSGTVPGAGSSIMSGTLNMKGTAATLQTATLTSNLPLLTLATGDMIGANFTGTITTLAGVCVTLHYYSNPGMGDCCVFRSVESGIADACFYIANHPVQVAGAVYVHSTAGTNGSAVNVQVVKDTGTDAPGAGTDLLTNNTNAGFNCKGTINVPQTGALTATTASLILAAGNRISCDFAGTTTALAGVVIVVYFARWYDRYKDITITCKANADCIDQYFWISSRSYRIVDASYINATAGTNGSAVDVQITVDDQTDAPGAGVDVLSNNTSAGFDCKTTANTVVAATFISEATRIMNPGNRASLDFAGTLTALAGVVVTITVEAI